MKKILISLAASTALVSGIQAQTFIAGWGLNDFVGEFVTEDPAFGSTTTGLDAGYSSFDPNGRGIEANAYGRLFLDGSFGSLTGSGFAFTTASFVGSGDIAFNTGGGAPISGTPNFGLAGGLIEDDEEAFGDHASLNNLTLGSGNSLVFSVTLAPQSLLGDAWAFSFAAELAGSASLEYSVNSGSSFLLADTFTTTAGAAAYNTTGITTGNVQEILFRFTNTGGGAFNVDNFATFATTSAVPEPSSLAAIFGVMGLGFAMLRRQRSR